MGESRIPWYTTELEIALNDAEHYQENHGEQLTEADANAFAQQLGTAEPDEVRIVVMKPAEAEDIERQRAAGNDVPENYTGVTVIACVFDLNAKPDPESHALPARPLTHEEAPASPEEFITGVIEDMNGLGASMAMNLARQLRGESIVGINISQRTGERVEGTNKGNLFLKFYSHLMEQPMELLGNMVAGQLVAVAEELAELDDAEFQQAMGEVFGEPDAN